ncbi:protein-glutamine gamma-glutamyltransferase E-like [Pelodytes ibericus]
MSEVAVQESVPLTQETKISGEFKSTVPQAVGKDVNVILVVKNPTPDSKEIDVKLRAYSTLYTRKEMHELLEECMNFKLKPNGEKEIPIDITYAQYEHYLTADNMIGMTAICSCEQTNETCVVQTSIVLDNPTFEIKLHGKAYIDKSATTNIVFTNPLNTEVCDIVVTAEGSGLLKDPITKRVDCVQAKGTITILVTLTPYKSGTKHLLVDITCDKFKNVKGFLEIEVHETDQPTCSTST